MPTRMRLKDKTLDIVRNNIDEFNKFGSALQTPPGYVRKVREWSKTWYGPDGAWIERECLDPVEQNKMTNLQTFRQNKSGRIHDMVCPRRKVGFQNMHWWDYQKEGGIDTEEKKRVLRDGLLLVVVEDDMIFVKNKYFESGRGIQVGLHLTSWGSVHVSATIISKKQPRPSRGPQAPGPGSGGGTCKVLLPAQV